MWPYSGTCPPTMKLTSALCVNDGVSTAASKPFTFTSDPDETSSVTILYDTLIKFPSLSITITVVPFSSPTDLVGVVTLSSMNITGVR